MSNDTAAMHNLQENINLSENVPFLRAAPATVNELSIDLSTLELTIGRSNLLPAWFLSVGAERARAVCKIKTSGTSYDGQQGNWSGTGFMVSPNIMLTNHHVLNSFETAQNGRCIFNYQKDPAGQILTGTVYRLNPSRLFVTSPVKTTLDKDSLDFTFVWVDGELGNEWGWVPLDRSSVTVKADEAANIIQHPNGDPKIVVVQENIITNHDLLAVRYESDTEPGSSGSCVMNNEWAPIALHHASRMKHNAPGQVENEGIKFSAIAAYLENLSHGDDSQEAAREVLKLFTGTDELMGFFGAMGRENPKPETGVEVVVNRYKGEVDDIDVGFWNVEWFVNEYERKMDDVAKVIVTLNLDVWALEETGAKATEALVNHLKTKYQLDFGCEFSEPNAPADKQTTAVIWNKKNIIGEKKRWHPEVDRWFEVRSTDFGDLQLEAEEGKVFDRYPALYYFRTANRSNNVGGNGGNSNKEEFNFYLVPLHLKAKSEGSKRRRMAAQILGAAVRKMKELGESKDEDWVLGGDFNASLASQDFQALTGDGFVPVNAEDEKGGAFSYVKGPKSLIDHIYLSPNLSRTYGADDFFIVAADKEFPDYIKNISDHRPVLVRFSLKNASAEASAAAPKPEIASLIEALKIFN